MIFDILIPPQGPKRRGKKCAVARPIHVSNSHTKFSWISSNGLAGDSITDGQTNRSGRLQHPLRLKKKRGDNNMLANILPLHTPLTHGVGSKCQFSFMKVVILHIKLMRMKYRTPRKQIFSLFLTLDPWMGSKGQNIFF